VSPTFDACLRSWVFDPWLLGALILTAGVYLRGWLVLHRRDPQRWYGGSLTAFVSGLSTIYIALASPIEPFSALLLVVHMLQHLLLMMVAPPLLWLGAPLFPLLRGLPRPVRIFWVAPFLSSPSLRRLFGRLTHPLTALLLFIATTWFWHVPAVYDRALRSSHWHYVQHICFLGTALVFWYPVVRAYPARPGWSSWLLLPLLLFADLSNTALSALLTFSDRVFYPYYAEVPRLGGLSVAEDQSAAGVLMWVPGSVAFLLPLFGIGIRLLSGGEGIRETRREGDKEVSRARSRISLPLAAPARSAVYSSPCHPVSVSGFNLLRVPLLGRFLKWQHSRLVLQLPLAALAGVVIMDGLQGPQVGPMNLAGVLPWIHWRGLVILSLLAAGNFFCMACPFLLPRTLARRWLPAGRSWPRWLRSKWLAVLLLALFLWAYEAFSLWNSPWWTAWLALSYFVCALVIDGFFRGAAFCKYVCPIGQFNFVQSLVAPLEVKVLNPKVCAECQTKDCIRGRDGIPGCELNLFQPRKAGNMDCTFCLDCIHACPQNNIGMLANPPGKDLWHDSFRSGVGRFGKRPDLAALVVMLVFGAFTNAAGMVAPVLEWRDQVASFLGPQSPLLVTSLFYMLGLLVLPVLLIGIAAAFSRWLGKVKESWRAVATRFAYSLAPLGFGMWLAHYSFHFLSSFDAVTPAFQRFAGDLGVALGQPEWQGACCRPIVDWLPRLEILFLDLGLLLALYTGYRLALTQSERMSQTVKVFVPCALLLLLLFASGIWIVVEPMQMRGTLLAAG
jgi:cytochrome c oxidase assembly factor CtaG